MPEVRLLGGRLRASVGTRSVRVPTGRVRELLDALVERGPDGLAALFYEDASGVPPQPHQDLRVLVNGRNIEFLDGLDTAVGANDSVTVFLAGARGWPGG